MFHISYGDHIGRAVLPHLHALTPSIALLEFKIMCSPKIIIPYTLL